MLDDVVAFLACPQCGAGLARSGAALRCARGHSFDIARQGYASLLPPSGPPGAADSAEMVAARAAFLSAGHYAGLAREIAAAAARAVEPPFITGSAVPGCLVDAGSGPGYYLATALDRLPDRAGLALDASRYALRRAARAHPRIGAVAADTWHGLPVADGAAALVLNIFAPRHGAELRRVLHPGGSLLVVTPGPRHLAELVGPLGLLTVDPRKPERLAATLSPYFAPASEQPYETTRRLSRADVAAAVAMGPSARHADPAALARQIAGLPDPLPVTVSVTIAVLRASLA